MSLFLARPLGVLGFSCFSTYSRGSAIRSEVPFFAIDDEDHIVIADGKRRAPEIVSIISAVSSGKILHEYGGWRIHRCPTSRIHPPSRPEAIVLDINVVGCAVSIGNHEAAMSSKRPGVMIVPWGSET